MITNTNKPGINYSVFYKEEIKMEKQNQEKYTKNLEEVIETSRTIRDFMLDEDKTLESREEHVRTMRTALEANKAIVSSVINIMQLEKLK